MILKPLQIWNLHAFVIYVVIIILFSVFIYRKYSTLAAITNAYFFLSGVFLVYGPFIFYGKFQRQVNDPVKSALFSGILCVGLVALLKEEHFKILFRVIKELIILNTMALWFFVCGVFNAGSMDLTVATMMLPFYANDYIKSKSKVDLAKILIIIGTSIFWGSTTPFISMAVVCVAWAFSAKGSLIKARYYLYGSIIAIGVGMISAGDYFFNMGNRTPVWSKVMAQFFENFNWFFGSGTGSYRWLGPVLQNERAEVLLFMHNEWLQIIFEQGFIGLALATSVAVVCIKNVYKTPHLFSAMIVFLVICIAQFPFRIELSFIYSLCLARICLTKKEDA